MPYLTKPKRVKKPLTESKKDANKIYNTQKWKNLRKSKLMNSPMCECCGVNLASQVHHKIPFMQFDSPLKRMEVGYDYNNLMSLCEECHIRLHQEDRKHKK